MVEIKELSALDIRYLIHEFEDLYSSRIDNIYHRDESLFLIMHKTGVVKKILKVMLPNFIYVSEIKEEMPQKPSNFCIVLRKYLKGARLNKIEQIGFERIIKCCFTSKQQTYYLIIELVAPGNIMLCNDKDKIIYPLYHQKWKDRVIKSGEVYQPIKKEISVLSLNAEALAQLLRKSSSPSIVVFIAKELGFGGRYAEEICKEIDIDKTKLTSQVDADKIFEGIVKRLNQKCSINSELDDLLSEKISKQATVRKSIVNATKRDKLVKTIELQETILKNLLKSAETNNLIADAIYSNYIKIKEIIDSLKKAREKYGWQEIRTRLINVKMIKKIDDKIGKITLEID
jgi:predicted ribosome quality control (RQC) complex YloA/Tae2 family protein